MAIIVSLKNKIARALPVYFLVRFSVSRSILAGEARELRKYTKLARINKRVGVLSGKVENMSSVKAKPIVDNSNKHFLPNKLLK
jgi:hypothetical protein